MGTNGRPLDPRRPALAFVDNPATMKLDKYDKHSSAAEEGIRDLASLFDETRPDPGASVAEIDRFVAAIGQPLSPTEVAEVIARNRIRS